MLSYKSFLWVILTMNFKSICFKKPFASASYMLLKTPGVLCKTSKKKTLKSWERKAAQLETLGAKEQHSGEFFFGLMLLRLGPGEAHNLETPMNSNKIGLYPKTLTLAKGARKQSSKTEKFSDNNHSTPDKHNRNNHGLIPISKSWVESGLPFLKTNKAPHPLTGWCQWRSLTQQ